jgi:anaphase-promoting complex subunit 2
MLKDMADSKRVNGNIRQMPQQALSPLRRQRRQTTMDNVSATIISALFWPQPQARPPPS